MSKVIDLTGMKFGRLTVLERAEKYKNGNYLWRCRCECGNFTVVSGNSLKSGHTQSCGCLCKENHTTHQMTHTKLYTNWSVMIQRCYNEKNEKYPRYGGRGIKVCERWKDFSNFYADVSQMEHFKEPGYSLDRIDNDGDYCPENVRWATPKQQARNRHNNIKVNYQGEEMTLPDAAEKSGINYGTLKYRYRVGLRGEELFRPVNRQ